MGNAASKTVLPGSRLEKEVAVLKGNSDLSEKEIHELYEEFSFEAESGTGRMNKRQFRKYYKKIAGIDDVDSVLADKAFNVFDTNHDDSIDFSEFVLASAVGIKKDLDSVLDLSFEMIDTSGDGFASHDEIKNFIGTALRLAVGVEDAATIDLEVITTNIFNRFHVDTEQKLSKKQFIDGCKTDTYLATVFGGA